LEEQRPEDFEALLRKFLAGQQLDPEQIAKAAGLPIDPKALQEMLAQLQNSILPGRPNQGLNWQLVETQAKQIANQSSQKVPESVAGAISQAAATGRLWLD
jgi:hypothetical protein